jgi:hypothetical protein
MRKKMLIEYYANDLEDAKIEDILQHFHIEHWYNPEDEYFVIKTNDERIVTILTLLGIEISIT